MKSKSFLISIEGIDGSGKSLFAKNLYNALLEKKLNVILTKEPGDTNLGKSLRKILHENKKDVCDLSEFLLFAADRAQHFEKIIIPALKSNSIIISDRMGDSSLAYQGYGRNLDIEMIKKVNQWTMQNINPDLIFYIKIDVQSALKRIFKRNEPLTSFEKEKMEFWQKVINGFEEIFKNKNNVIYLDGTLSPAKICKNAIEILEQKL